MTAGSALTERWMEAHPPTESDLNFNKMPRQGVCTGTHSVCDEQIGVLHRADECALILPCSVTLDSCIYFPEIHLLYFQNILFKSIAELL